MKPVPPPKPVHLKVSRVASAQEAVHYPPQAKPRKLSDVDAHNRIPPPSVPPPVSCVQLMIKINLIGFQSWMSLTCSSSSLLWEEHQLTQQQLPSIMVFCTCSTSFQYVQPRSFCFTLKILLCVIFRTVGVKHKKIHAVPFSFVSENMKKLWPHRPLVGMEKIGTISTRIFKEKLIPVLAIPDCLKMYSY